MMSSKKLWIAAALVVVGTVMGVDSWAEATALAKPTHREPVAVVQEGNTPTLPAITGDYALLNEVLFFTSPSLTRFWNIAHDRKSVKFSTYELFTGGQLGEFHQEVSTSFSIQDIAPRGGNEVFVGGYPRRGGFVVERWTIEDVTGTTTGEIALSSAPVGVGIPPATPTVYIPGGVQIPLAQRSPPPVIARETVFEDSAVTYKGIGADPEGRFLLVVTENAELRQYFPGGSLNDYALLANASTLPDLEHIEGLFKRVQHATFGRVWFMEWHQAKYPNGTFVDVSQYQTVVLQDADNDGVFELITPHLSQAASLMPYEDDSLWLEEFISAP